MSIRMIGLDLDGTALDGSRRFRPGVYLVNVPSEDITDEQ